LENLILRMEREEFDLVAVGRALLADPYWAAKVKRGDTEDLRSFDPKALQALT
jgi:2,4-dienoyl-CoA reductase-like NADH-dependent reductase (Old Yellow Enzyme family)